MIASAPAIITLASHYTEAHNAQAWSNILLIHKEFDTVQLRSKFTLVHNVGNCTNVNMSQCMILL